SSWVLIAFLVLFILISLAEGGVIYSFSGDKAQADADLKKEQAEKKKVEGDVDWYRHLYLRLKEYLGIPMLDKEKDAYLKLCDYWGTSGDKLNPREKELKDPTVLLVKEQDQKTKFDPTSKTAAASYTKQVETLDAALKQMTDAKAKAEKAEADARKAEEDAKA